MIQLIPAMDLIGGRCVRLLQGNFAKETVYSDDPVGTAAAFEGAGIKRLHLVDLDGARTRRLSNLDVLRQVTKKTGLRIDFGGGVRSTGDVKAIFDSGAEMVTIGSLAVTDPYTVSSWAKEFGAENFMIGIDVRDGRAAVNGWLTDTETGLNDVISSLMKAGLERYFVTDIAKDGAMVGPAIDLYEQILVAFPGIELIASGGVRTIKDVAELDRIRCSGVIVGRALYEENITLEEAARYAR